MNVLIEYTPLSLFDALPVSYELQRKFKMVVSRQFLTNPTPTIVTNVTKLYLVVKQGQMYEAPSETRTLMIC